MCGIFGFSDTNRQLTYKQKNRLLRLLAQESEERGTDAAGIAYNYGNKTIICKRPGEAQKARFSIPDSVTAVLGHTRMTTQGSAKKNVNNHPFSGIAGVVRFAFTHNGIIYNDRELYYSERLPKTAIETDSYVAVQLIEKENALSFSSLKSTAEKTRGSFIYSILDEHDNFWIVKGDNPIALYRFKSGLYVYASTEQILQRALNRTGWAFTVDECIELDIGGMVHIDKTGTITRGKLMPVHKTGYSIWDDEFCYSVSPKRREREDALRDEIMSYLKFTGVTDKQISLLIDAGYDITDIAEMTYDPEFFAACLDDATGYSRVYNCYF